MLKRSSGSRKGTSNNLLLDINPKPKNTEIRNKSQNTRDSNNIDAETNDTNNQDENTALLAVPTMLKTKDWAEESKRASSKNIFVLEALDNEPGIASGESKGKIQKFFNWRFHFRRKY